MLVLGKYTITDHQNNKHTNKRYNYYLNEITQYTVVLLLLLSHEAMHL